MSIYRTQIGLWAVVMIGATTGFSQPLSSTNLLSLMEASRSRYQTMEVTVQEQGFQVNPNNPVEKTLFEISDIHCRLSPRFNHFQLDSHLLNEPERDYTEVYGWSTMEMKGYRSYQSGRKVNGWIDGYNPTSHPATRTFNEIIWGPMIDFRMRASAATVTRTEDCYVVEYMHSDDPQSAGRRIRIDPAKDFVPISYVVINQDKSPAVVVDFGDWAKIDGVWIPKTWSAEIVKGPLSQKGKVVSISVNRWVSGNTDDFAFPPGTIIDDRIRNVSYKEAKLNVSQTRASGEGSLALTVAAADQDLAQAAQKADMIARQQSAARTPAKIDLSPAFVWVLPGKNQYTLELISDTKTRPTLSGKSISDSPLILGSVDDQLAASGKLIVTLERPDGQKAFVDAVLTLDFAGTKTPIHFVAAPLP